MTSPQDTLRNLVEIGAVAARLRHHELRGDDESPSTPDWERGARAGLTHYRPAVEALSAILKLLRDSHDTNHDPEGAVAAICEATLEAVR